MRRSLTSPTRQKSGGGWWMPSLARASLEYARRKRPQGYIAARRHHDAELALLGLHGIKSHQCQLGVVPRKWPGDHPGLISEMTCIEAALAHSEQASILLGPGNISLSEFRGHRCAASGCDVSRKGTAYAVYQGNCTCRCQCSERARGVCHQRLWYLRL